MHKLFASLALAMSILPFQQAWGHFQLIYNPQLNFEKAGEVPVKLLFWHPMENAHAMDMGAPLEFYSAFKGKKTDLSASLKPMTFQGKDNSAAAFDGAFSMKRNGDYHVVVKPAPYLEESEDIFIQQITKVTYNKGGVPTDWSEPLGLETEIVPLQKPYGVIAGSTFTGVVLSDGKPAAGVEIEIEHMTSEPDMKTNKTSNDKSVAMAGGAIALITDANGQFTFGIPKSGFWGFAALGSGPVTEHMGKELSQDAVLWIEAHELGE